MKKIVFIIFILSTNLFFSQEKNNNYFSLYKDGKSYLKPIKYILFLPERDREKDYKSDIFFYIQGERFVFSKNIHSIDTCSNIFFKKLKFEDVSGLKEKEYLFFKQKVNENNLNKKLFSSMPLTKTHLFFKVFIIKKVENDKYIKYEVDWEYSHSY
ncbi:hypothetical protein Lupro_03105 [Lutibacter profundi]|uniref:Uncharacterized protein n=1 Tax=Lutibacter profundi TaxID=1622118 RepID=A0A0X8G581_9FLAO|nr:hypothetical protein [Lutibacter profundi]AMC10304.1 hypothetical protein Lupro_03105 [Lutibacter profundi]